MSLSLSVTLSRYSLYSACGGGGVRFLSIGGQKSTHVTFCSLGVTFCLTGDFRCANHVLTEAVGASAIWWL